MARKFIQWVRKPINRFQIVWCGCVLMFDVFIHACAQMLTLIVEAIDTVDGGALMISPQEEKILRVFDLIGQ